MSIPLLPPPGCGPPPQGMFIGPPASAIPPPYGPTVGFAIPVPDAPVGHAAQPLINTAPAMQSALVPVVPTGMAFGQPSVQILQPAVQPVLQPVMKPMIQSMIPMSHPVVHPHVSAGYWPATGAQPAGYMPMSMSGGVSTSRVQQATGSDQPPASSVPEESAHTASPILSPAQAVPTAGTASRNAPPVDESAAANRSAEGTGIQATDSSSEEQTSKCKRKRFEDAIDWIHDHTAGKCQLCSEIGHIAVYCPKWTAADKTKKPFPLTRMGEERMKYPYLKEGQVQWIKATNALSSICLALMPSLPQDSRACRILLQHLLEFINEKEHNVLDVFRWMEKPKDRWSWHCMRRICDSTYEGSTVEDGACKYCSKQGQPSKLCLQISSRLNGKFTDREVPADASSRSQSVNVTTKEVARAVSIFQVRETV